MDKNDIIDYVMHTPHNTNKAVLSGMLNQLTEGGGSSDFSTANVTLINRISDINVELLYPMLVEEEGEQFCATGITNGNTNIQETFTVLTAKDGCMIPTVNTGIPSRDTITVSGNAEVTGGVFAFIRVTGDCTITVGSSSPIN